LWTFCVWYPRIRRNRNLESKNVFDFNNTILENGIFQKHFQVKVIRRNIFTKYDKSKLKFYYYIYDSDLRKVELQIIVIEHKFEIIFICRLVMVKLNTALSAYEKVALSHSHFWLEQQTFGSHSVDFNFSWRSPLSGIVIDLSFRRSSFLFLLLVLLHLVAHFHHWFQAGFGGILVALI
jgi:hypothetical protein